MGETSGEFTSQKDAVGPGQIWAQLTMQEQGVRWGTAAWGKWDYISYLSFSHFTGSQPQG